MKKNLTIFLSIVIIIGLYSLSLAQFKPEELSEDAKWETFLTTAKITAKTQMGGSEAVTNPWRLTLEKDGVTNDALWKNPEGRQKGFIEGWKWEIAAYRIDRLFGLNMIPVTVEREFQGSRGSCQLWVNVEMDLRKKAKDKIKIPSYKVYPWNMATYLHRAFDNLIANEDRHQGNVLITKDWRMILIDHSRSFRTSKKFTNQLLYTEKHTEGPKEMKMLPRTFVDKLKSLTFDIIKKAVGEYLNNAEINAVLARRDLIIDWLDDRIKQLGEDKVLYDIK